jgi:hypothetical protein
MTSRYRWLLVGAALGIASPGCHLFPRNPPDAISQDDPAFQQIARVKAERDNAVWAIQQGVPGTVEFEPPGVAKPGEQPEGALSGPKHPLEQPVIMPQAPMHVAVQPADPPAPVQPQTTPEPATIKLAPLVAALQCFLDDRPEEAIKHLEAYDRETQLFYLRSLPPLTIFARKPMSELSAQEITVLTDQLQNLVQSLRPRTRLEIGHMCYATDVRQFGIYQPLPEGHAFVAESGDRFGEVVVVYAEVRNATSVQRGTFFETELHSKMEIRDANGQTLHQLKFQEEGRVRVLARLNDYYNAYRFVVPPLPPGTYQLVLEIADDTIPGSRRVAQKAIEFRVTPVGTRPQ